jgi:dGTPase
VSQIARTIAKGLRLNEDLTEAISLAHDLGHTPFGHAGEACLNRITPYGFSHTEQSLRVVDLIERDGAGLNLTLEVRDGIIKHSKGKGDVIPTTPAETAITLEGQVVRVADIIAYINHDLDDAIRGGVICNQDIPRDYTEILGTTQRARIDTMVKDVLYHSMYDDTITLTMSPDVLAATEGLRDFLYDSVYDSKVVHGDFNKASKILSEIYERFTRDTNLFLQETQVREWYDDVYRCVCDYIAGMTDRYAFDLYERLFLPRPWIIL